MADIYKTFRGVESLAQRFSLSKRFDEPTYFSFRLVFGSDSDRVYNMANSQALYDTMPHPLFNPASKIIIPAFSSGVTIPQTESVAYSAMDYLNNSNEPTRVSMLEEFITKFNNLQYQYPYYFQSIDGVSDLLKVDPTKGQRISNDKKISITCLEGLDLRMSYLMNLYKKIVWDDVYQRWVLPDMMRYFTLTIYLAEFRTFHTPNGTDGYGTGQIPLAAVNVPQSNVDPNQLIRPKQYSPIIPAPAQNSLATSPLYLKILDNVLPTWVITCEMCEFDITDVTHDHLNGLSVATDPAQGAVKFGVKIGNIKELQTYPTFQHMFLSDRKLNGLNRAQDTISTSSDSNSSYVYPATLQVAQTRDAASPDNQHISGTPYTEQRNKLTITDTQGILPDPAPSSELNSHFYDDRSGQPTTAPVDPNNPNTVIGNAIQFGAAFAKNIIKKVVDKAKITDIPGLGVSFTEIKAAIQSKDIISVLGLIRKGINETVKGYGNAPSERLNQPIQTDNIMRGFLTTLTKSEATDDDTLALQGAANMALNDANVWKKITDLSLATNLIGKGEVNSENKIASPNTYTQIQQKESNIIVIPVPVVLQRIDANAASGKISEGILNQGSASSLLAGNITQNQINEGIASERLVSSTEGGTNPELAASSNLGGQIGTNNVQTSPSSKLGTKVENNSTETKASANLSGDITGSGPQPKSSTLLTSNLQNNVDIPIASSLLNSGIQGKVNQPSASVLLANELNGGEKIPVASTLLGSTIEGNKIDRPAPSILSRKIDVSQVIEYAPTSAFKPIEDGKFKQPDPGQAIKNGQE